MKSFLFVGVAPVIGSVLLGFLFFKALVDYADPANSYSGSSWFGVAPPAVIGVGFLVLGLFLLLAWRRHQREPFFLRRREVAPAGHAGQGSATAAQTRARQRRTDDGVRGRRIREQRAAAPASNSGTSASASATLLAVDDLGLDLAGGEFFTLLGPSGCGKTTTLRMIAGFEQPTEGEVRIEGEDVAGLPPHKRPTNTVFQSYALFPHLSVEDNVAFGLKRKRVAKDEIAERVAAELERVGLGARGEAPPAQLSGGMQQRVALARALVNLPKVLLLDEPLGALDLKLRKGLQVELKRIQREVGITFVYVTHDQEEALTMSDRIAVMNRGRVEQVGDPEDVYERPDDDLRRRLHRRLQPDAGDGLRARRGAARQRPGGRRPTPAGSAPARAATRWCGRRSCGSTLAGRRRRAPAAAARSRASSRARSTSGPRPRSSSTSATRCG